VVVVLVLVVIYQFKWLGIQIFPTLVLGMTDFYILADIFITNTAILVSQIEEKRQP